MVGRVVRLLSALSVVTGMFLTVVGMVEGPTASAQTNVVGQVADATGNLSEYSICQPVLSGTASSVVCSERGKPGGDDIQGAVAVDGNFQGVDFYVGKHLSGSVVLSVAGSVGGTVNVQGPGNIGVYGNQDLAQLPAANCATPGNCPTPNLVDNPALQPNYNTINLALENLSNSLTGTAQTGTATYSATYRSLRLVGTATDVNTFYVDAATLTETSNLYITVPPGSSTVINVNGSVVCSSAQPCLQNVFYWNGTAFEGGNQYNSPAVEQLRASTLLNFPGDFPLTIYARPLQGGLSQAPTYFPPPLEKITLDSSGPAINVLAPWADFTDNNGVFYGFIYANQVNGDFQNDLPGGGPVPPTTTTTTTTTTVPTTSTTTTTVPTSSTTVPTSSTTVPTTVPSTTVPTTVPSTTVPTTVPSTTTTRPTTTTTRPTTTTSAATTSTTTPKPQKPVTKAKSGGTTTTVPATTTTAVTTTVPVSKGNSGTTTVPSTTTPSTRPKLKPTTSTTSPAVTTTTVAKLAYTGTSSAGPLTGAGLALIVAGGLVMGLSTRRRRLA